MAISQHLLRWTGSLDGDPLERVHRYPVATRLFELLQRHIRTLGHS